MRRVEEADPKLTPEAAVLRLQLRSRSHVATASVAAMDDPLRNASGVRVYDALSELRPHWPTNTAPLTCSSVIQVQCQYDWPVSLTKNSLSALPFMGGGGGASGGASGAGGTGMGGGGSPHRQWRILWTRPLMGGH